MNTKLILFITTILMISTVFAEETSKEEGLSVTGWIGTVVVIGIVSVLTVLLVGLTAFCECADLKRFHIE